MLYTFAGYRVCIKLQSINTESERECEELCGATMHPSCILRSAPSAIVSLVRRSHKVDQYSWNAVLQTKKLRQVVCAPPTRAK